MATGAAGDGFLRGIFEVCLSGGDTGVQRRPYHKNCGCELHKSRGHCSHQSRNNAVSYPIRRSWSEGSLALMGGAASGNSTPCSSTSPAFTAPGEIRRTQTQLVLCKEDDDDKGVSISSRGHIWISR